MKILKYSIPFLISIFSTTAIAGNDQNSSLGVKSVSSSAKSIDKNHSWSGPYIGLFSGYNSNGIFNNLTNSDSYGRVNGLSYGGVIGYDFQSDMLLFGIALDASVDSSKGVNSAGDAQVTLENNYTARLRGGFLLRNDLLAYFTGGFSYLRAKGDYLTQSLTDKEFHNGSVIGAGLEFRLADNVGLFSEYRQYSFSKATYKWGSNLYDVDYSSSRVDFGIKYYW